MIEEEFLKSLLNNALYAAIKSGEEIIKIYDSSNEYNVNLKSDNTIIIEADRVSHEALRKHLSKTRVPLMSEEGRDIDYQERYGWDLYWLIDPIDGTLEFVRKSNQFAICIALMEKNIPILGVVVAPAFNQIYFAMRDKGAFRVDNIDFSGDSIYDIDDLIAKAVPIQCLKEKPTEEIKILNALSNPTTETEKILKYLSTKYPKVDSCRYGSALKFCRMAEGAAHLYFRTSPLKDWDTAAGEIIAKESGLKVVTMSGAELVYNKQELVIDSLMVSYHDNIV